MEEMVAVVGLMLSRRIISAGERLNLMLIAINASELIETRDFVIYLQLSDKPEDGWTLAAVQRVDCPVGEATHVYFSITPESMAETLGHKRWIKSCEILVWAACASPAEGSQLPEAEGISDIFCIQGSCLLHSRKLGTLGDFIP